jgi:hypothetical protein
MEQISLTTRATVVLLLLARTAVSQAPKLQESGSPGLLRISTAAAGAQPTSVSDATTTLHIRSGTGSAKKVTAQINAAMPANVSLSLTIAPPPGATSLGAVPLTTTARDIVTAIPTGVNTNVSMTYALSASVDAGVVSSASRSVTLTLLDSP